MATLIQIKGFDFDNENATTEAVWLTDWVGSAMEAYEMVGGYFMVGGSLQRFFPAPCPYFSGLVCKSAKVVPVGDWDSVNGGYKQAFINVAYGIPKAEDTLKTDFIDYFTVKTAISAEALSIPGKPYKWAVPVGNPSASDVLVNEGELLMQKWLATMEITMQCRFFQNMKSDTFRKAVGKVNNATLTDPEGTTYEAETILFVGIEQERLFTPEGYVYVPRNLKFLVRSNTNPGSPTVHGWNSFWCEKYVAGVGEGSWQPVTPKPYDSTDFDDLFTD